MKTKLILAALPVIFLLTQCLPTKSVSFNAETNEAKVDFSVELKNIRILNRTRPPKRSLVNVLTDGQGSGLINRPGVDQLLSSFTSELRSRRYFSVKTPIKIAKAEQSNGFPIALGLEELQSYFNDTMSVVASLEIFQVDEDEAYYNERKMQMDTSGNEYYINIVRGVKTMKSLSGWRLYNGKTGEVIDEFTLNYDHTYQVEGVDRPNAASKMEARVDQAYVDLGKSVGFEYADRISPVALYVSRTLYIKSKSCYELKQAAGFIKNKDWKTAKDIWEEALLTNSKPKDLAKLHYNLGVSYEREGDLVKAIEQLELSLQYHSLGKWYLNKLKNVKATGYPVPKIK